MSSSAAGKFQDHYVILGIDPKADSEMIQAAYTKLSEHYHPSNRETGSKDKFDMVNQAFEVLSDAGLRAEFDKLKGVGQDDSKPQFTGLPFFDALKQSADLRSTILCVLCDRRRVRSFRPSISNRHLESMLNVTNEELSFALWYLKQRVLVINDDKSSLQITVDGLDYLERHPPSPKAVLALLKPEAVKEMPAVVEIIPPEPIQAGDADNGSGRESVLLALSRSLSRESSTQARSVVVPAKRPAKGGV